jgi:hypothetical protein
MAIEDGVSSSGAEGSGGSNNYSAIGYSYDTGTAEGAAESGTAPNGVSMGPVPKKLNKDLPYVQPLGLYIPHDLYLVSQTKLKLRICLLYSYSFQ